MKKDSYMDRAERARDPRFARVLGKMGYERRDMVAAGVPLPTPKSTVPVPRSPTPPPPPEMTEMKALREAYEAEVGKRPFNGWDAATLREKIAAAKTGA